ncbi:DUF4012 domain-containing protein [Candidatus Beckwithbacteria bacterium]|nr:DUF4012 domain-containing protein [Candidatus Beckwithbacteria bacterium]
MKLKILKFSFAKFITFLIISVLFVFLTYFSFLIFYNYQFFQELKKGNFNKAKTKSEQVLQMTGFVSKLPLFTYLRQGHQTFLSFFNLKQNGEIFFKNIFDGRDSHFSQNLVTLANSYQQFEKDFNDFYKTTENLTWAKTALSKSGYLDKFEKYSNLFFQNQILIKDLLTYAPDFLNDKKTYTVLFQNNMELRATGGFMGSYGQFYFTNGKLVSKNIQDIYVPDGQLDGFVNPPKALSEAFKHGEWRLRDSNWDPDFAKASETISWFFDKGGVKTGDGLIAVNLEVVEDILNTLGQIELPDYDTQIAAQNLYLIAQNEAERDFFPGSTAKKDFLQTLTNQLFLSLSNLDNQKMITFGQILARHLQQKNIQVNFTNPKLQAFANQNHWTGTINWEQNKEFNNDYFFPVDTNLSANKANCCIVKEVSQVIEDKGDYFAIKTLIKYENNSPVADPKPPKYWGGDYKNYLRILLPLEANIKNVLIDEESFTVNQVDKRELTTEGLKEIGFFLDLEHLQTKTVEVQYVLKKQLDNETYQLFLPKQSGQKPYYTSVELLTSNSSQKTKKLIDQDQMIQFK